MTVKVALKKWAVQWLQLCLLIPAILADGLTLFIGVGLQAWSKKLAKTDASTTKYKVCAAIILVLTLGLPKLATLLGKAVAWCQGVITSEIDKLKTA
jgi:hypothetical protein